MKIARVCPYYYGKKENLDSGLKPYYYNLVKELNKNNIENDIYTLESDTNENVFLVKKRKRLSYILFGYDVYKKLKDKNYKIIHTHQANSFLLYFFKKKLNAKFVHTIHGSPVAYKKVPIRNISSLKDVVYFYLFNKYICKRADAIINVSSEGREEAIKNFNIKPEKVFFIPTGVDLNVFKKLKIKKDIDLLYVGRFVAKKNILRIIDVSKKTNTNLYLIGGNKNDSEYSKIINLINEHKLQVKIIDSINQEKLVEFYNRAKIFILLSYEEGMPKVLLESLACGTPAIVSNNSGMKDVIVNGKNGFLVDYRNDEEIMDKIKLILNNEIKLNAQYNIKKFSWNNIAKEIIQIYKKL